MNYKQAFHKGALLGCGFLAGALVGPVVVGMNYAKLSGAVRTSCPDRPPKQPVHGFLVSLTYTWNTETTYGTNNQPGDKGRSLGHFQGHQGHWDLGNKLLGTKWNREENQYNLARCAAITAANWAHWCPKALKSGEIETLIRSHRWPAKPFDPDNDLYFIGAMSKE